MGKLILIVTAAHAGFMPAAEAFIATYGTAEQQRVCARLWSGTFETPAQMMEYYTVMAPLYSRSHDPAKAAPAHRRAIYAPEPLNRAFGPHGFLRRYDLRDDWICPPRFSEEIHRLIPGSQLQVFADSSHSIRADEPKRLNAAIRAFVAAPLAAPGD